MRAAGTVTSLSRFPVKSMRGEETQAVDLHWTWLHGDRHYAFVRSGDTSAFPWLTARQVPDLVRYVPCYAQPDDPRHSSLSVTDPDGRVFDIRDQALAAQLAAAAGEPVWLLRLGRGAFDAMPVSVLTTSTLARIAGAHGSAVAPARFRANIVIRPDDPAETEQDWLGRSLSFGPGPDAPCLHLDWAIPRCAMIGIDPETGARDAALIRTVVRQFGNAVGVYCAVWAPGTVRLGDRIYIA